MMVSFDLCRTTSEGTEWVGTFMDLRSAKLGLTELAEMNPGHYAIYDQSIRDSEFSPRCSTKSRIRNRSLMPELFLSLSSLH